MTAPRILLVEDEPMIVMVMETLLAEFGCEVVGSFGSVESTLAWLSSASPLPDGAVLDVNLGGETAYPIAAALEQLKVPVVFLTGYGAVDDARFEGAPLLAKPVEFEALARAVAHFPPRGD